MGYEIVYNVFTVKQDNKYFPFVVCGSNNCYEHSGRRERNLNILNYFFKDKKEYFNSLEELKACFNSELIQKNINDGNIQGRFKTAKSFLNQFLSKVINNKELGLKHKFSSIYYLKGSDEDKRNIEEVFNKIEINGLLTVEERQNKINEVLNLLNEDLKTKLKNYGTSCLLFTPYEEYAINRCLEFFKVDKIKKEVTNQEILNKLNSDKSVIINSDNDLKLLNQWLNKSVYFLDKYNNVYKRTIKEYNDRIIAMLPKSRRRFNYLSFDGGGYAEISIKKAMRCF